MLQQLPKELTKAKELMDHAKLDEALEIIEQFEKNESLSPKVQLSVLLIKGRIYLYKQRMRKAQQFFEVANQMSQDLGLVPESVSALIGKANVVFVGDLDKAFSHVLEAEKRLKSLADDSSIGLLRRDLLLIKSWILFYNGNFTEASELAQECLRLTEREHLGNKLDLALIFLLLGYINREHFPFQESRSRNLTKALDFAMKSLELNKELNHAVAIADNYSLLASIYDYEGEHNLAKKCIKQSLSIKEISGLCKVETLGILASIYHQESEYDKTIRYRRQQVALAEKLNFTYPLINNLLNLAYNYKVVGRFNLAVESAKRALKLSEKSGSTFYYQKARSLLVLTWIYIDEGSREVANQYFSRLSEFHDQTKGTEDVDLTIVYLLSKASIMKTSNRLRDRIEAQALYKELLDSDLGPVDFLRSLGNLCDLLLEELSLSNESEILDEIPPLITKSLEIAEAIHSYHWLAETKLLQAKLALIKMDIEEAKKLMVEAQRIADLYSLNLLASKISSEHDKLLDQIDVWDTVKKQEAPMAERIKLASMRGVLERIQGKRAVEPPESADEEPIFLLIMDESGLMYFTHPFVKNWDHSDLFSLFVSALNNISDEIFSKSIDRIKIKENTILIHPIEQFLVCYVIKGQSYPALQKLTRFADAIRENSEIWQALNKSVKTSEVMELDKPPALKTVIDEIFT
ncbi:MAG: tetratricopeptide repeat protein [Promethearchaeota archaeon]|jgi:tetratricopeptide (TPR) repeat protein